MVAPYYLGMVMHVPGHPKPILEVEKSFAYGRDPIKHAKSHPAVHPYGHNMELRSTNS